MKIASTRLIAKTLLVSTTPFLLLYNKHRQYSVAQVFVMRIIPQCKAHHMDNPSAMTVLRVCVRGWVIPVKSGSKSFQQLPKTDSICGSPVGCRNLNVCSKRLPQT